jgi:hypothetical protein
VFHNPPLSEVEVQAPDPVANLLGKGARSRLEATTLGEQQTTQEMQL